MTHVAAAITTFIRQCDEFAPHRSHISDGTWGDAAHQKLGNRSDHNPWYNGIVTAVDITHDSDRGLDCNDLANSIISSKDTRRKYLIWNGRIFEFRLGFKDSGRWAKYDGDPHTSHLHLSIMPNSSVDSVVQWSLYTFTVLQLNDWNDRVAEVQRQLNRIAAARLVTDGIFGMRTLTAVRNYQGKHSVVVDGIVGPVTLRLLGIK